MKRLVLFVLLLAATPAVAASPPPDLVDARSLAMGGALRTLAGPLAAPRLNPAALGPPRGFYAGSSWATRSAGAFDAFTLTIVDNITSPLGGAFDFLRLQGEQVREEVSLSLAAGGRGLWWGFNGRYLHWRQRHESSWHDAGTLDVGFLCERPGGWRFAAVGFDLIESSYDVPLHRRVGFGVSKQGVYGWTLAADAVRNFDKDVSRGTDVHLGAERALFEGDWQVRFGQMWRGETGKDYASLGVGWTPGSWSLGYGVQKARQRSGEWLHAFSASGQF